MKKTSIVLAGICLLFSFSACSQQAKAPTLPQASDRPLAAATGTPVTFAAHELEAMNQYFEAAVEETGGLDITPEAFRAEGLVVYQYSNHTFLVWEGAIHLLAGGWGSTGAEDLCLYDVNGDGTPEVYTLYSVGSGGSMLQIGVLDLASGEAYDVTGTESLGQPHNQGYLFQPGAEGLWLYTRAGEEGGGFSTTPGEPVGYFSPGSEGVAIVHYTA